MPGGTGTRLITERGVRSGAGRCAALLTRAVVVVLALSWCIAAAGSAAGARPPEIVTPDTFVAMLSDGDVDTTGLVVDGDVDLSGLRRIDRLVRCRDCTIRGDLRAVDVTFARVVDLSGVRIDGDLDLHGATFADVLTLGGARGDDAHVAGSADFSLTGFGGLGALDEVEFGGPVDLSEISTASTLSMSGARFTAPVSFQHAHLGGALIATAARFEAGASFALAKCTDAALFRDASFAGEVSFDAATFEGRMDFSSAEFDGPVAFDDVVLEGPGIFRRVDAADRFSWEQSFAQSLDFTGAVFAAPASFSGLSTSGVLVLDEAVVIPNTGLLMGAMSPAGLRMDVGLVDQVAGPTTRIEALARIEATAEADGDLALANEARYALLSMQRDDRGGIAHLVDSLLYRGVAGYLVRPVHPLLTLAVLVVVAGVVRASTRPDRPLWVWERSRLVEGRDRRRRPSRAAMVTAGHAVGVGVHDALRQVVRVRRSSSDGQAPPPTVRSVLLGLESVLYTVLLAAALLALSNSSATLREVIDAVRG